MSLEQHSQADDQPRRVLEGQLRECFGRVVYSHKTHEKCADILLSRQSNLCIWQIVLSALTTAGFFTALFGDIKAASAVGLIVSTALLILNAYTKNYNLGELAQKHKQAASSLWLVREKYLSLLTDVRMDRSMDELLKSRDILMEELHAAYAGAPSTTSPAYKKAQHALQKSEELTFSDHEIDAFLPRELKRVTPAQQMLVQEAEKIIGSKNT